VARISLEGPDALILSREDILALLRVSEKTLDRMIDRGRFPSGIKASPGGQPFWTNVDIACWLHIAPRLNFEPDDEPQKGAKKSGGAES